MGKFSVDGDDYDEGPSNRRRVKKRKITPEEEDDDDDDVEIEPEATEDQSCSAEEDDEEQGSEQEEEYDAIEDEADQNSEESVGSEELRSYSRSIARRAVEIPRVTDDRGKSISVILTDPEVLDCCICYEVLSSPVYQCENGHIACSSCCVKLGNKCPMCSMPIGYNRCRALEKVLESVKVSCPNAAYGCKELLSYSTRSEHENECIYVPCLCPKSGCNTVASSKDLSLHFSQIHVGSGISFWYERLFWFDLKIDSKVTVLQAKNDGNLFILNNYIGPFGKIVKVNGIGPNSSNSEFQYDLYAKSKRSCLKLQSLMEFSPGQIANTPTTGFLLIPTDFVPPHELEQIKLRIRIRRVKPQIRHMQQRS